MSEYKYFFSTLRDEVVVAEIDLFGVYMDLELNAGGQFNGSFKLDQTGKRNQDLLDATLPGRTYVTCEREGIVIWSGYVWSRTYMSQAKNIQIFAQSFEKYPTKRFVRANLAYTNQEQRNIFRELWIHMQSYTGSNLNINVPPAFEDVVLKSTTVSSTDMKLYSEVMEAIADAEDGFDWYISTVRLGNVYYRTINIGYPTIGSRLGPDSLIFEYPGSITNYYQTESMKEAGTNVFVIGSGDGSSMAVAESTQPEMLNTGFPRWDIVAANKDVADQPTINQIAIREGAIRKPPMTMITFTTKADRQPEFGAWALGDQCTVVIKDSRNPNGFSIVNRIVKWELVPSSSENSEEATIHFAGDEDA